MDEVPVVGIDAEALLRVLTRQRVVLPTSWGARVQLIAGEIPWDKIAELAQRALREAVPQ